jgi:hypothetical protein
MTRTYHYDEATRGMVEGPAPRKADQGSGDGWRFSDRLYSAAPFKAPDGTVIDSRRKHREYLRRHHLTTADDFTHSWERAAHERAMVFSGDHDHRERREAIARAVEKAT